MRANAAAKHGAEHKPARTNGFTLLELMAVMAILLVLIALGAARYEQTIVRAREAALRQDLDEMNKAIQEYTADKQAAPTSLDDLVQAHPSYLGRIPNDPMTGKSDWVPENCDMLDSSDQLSTGICSVHSSSDSVSPTTDTPYSSW
jgi:general secretion pathway protein G